MKITAILLFFFSSTFVQHTPEEQLLPTKLRITVIDGLGNFVEGASVSIYDSEDDYRASANPIATEVTDKKGKVIFKGLKPISYFVEAKKEEMNNNGEGVRTAPLSEGRVNKVNTVIE